MLPRSMLLANLLALLLPAAPIFNEELLSNKSSRRSSRRSNKMLRYHRTSSKLLYDIVQAPQHETNTPSSISSDGMLSILFVLVP
jgi:hypothetical protein